MYPRMRSHMSMKVDSGHQNGRQLIWCMVLDLAYTLNLLLWYMLVGLLYVHLDLRTLWLHDCLSCMDTPLTYSSNTWVLVWRRSWKYLKPTAVVYVIAQHVLHQIGQSRTIRAGWHNITQFRWRWHNKTQIKMTQHNTVQNKMTQHNSSD